MDINTLRTVITVAAMLAFLGIVAWAYSSRRKEDFDAAARLPFEEDEMAGSGNGEGTR
jgi:cytochrome c oxidase cbb3-type subunit 4